MSVCVSSSICDCKSKFHSVGQKANRVFWLGMDRSIFKTYNAGLLLSRGVLSGAGCWW